AVVACEDYGSCVWKVVVEGEDVFDGGSAERINRLIVVADDGDVLRRAEEKLHDFVLRAVRVLELVHEYVAVTILNLGTNCRALAEKLMRVKDQIAKVEGLMGK